MALGGTTAWKQAGISYLQYLGLKTSILRSVLKVIDYLQLVVGLFASQEPVKSRALARQQFSYNKSIGLSSEKGSYESVLISMISLIAYATVAVKG
jgi:hypothetical protein